MSKADLKRKQNSVRRSEMTRDDIGLKIIDDRHPIFAKTCHGNPERSFWFRGRPLPLCSRCITFYPFIIIGIPVGVIITRFLDLAPLFMLVLVLGMFIPLIVDGYTQYIGWRRSDNMRRAVTGSIAGIGSGIAAVYIIAGIIGAI